MGVGLHVHSEGSFLDGLSSVQQIVNRAVLLGHDAVAVTDHGECNQHFELQKRATKAGIKPIFGMEGYFVDSIERVKKEKDRLNSHIVFWAENDEGLKNLWSISSLAYLKGFYYRPLADFEMLREYSKGLMVSDSCMLTDLSRAIIRDDEETVRRSIGTLLSIYGENNYFMELHTWQFTDEDTFLEEIRRADTIIEDPRVDSLTLAEARKTKKDYEGLIKLNRDMTKINQVKSQLAKEMGIPLVVVNDAHYAEPEQWENHALVWQMSTNDDQIRGGRTAAWQMSDEEMVEWMAKHGISRSVTEEALRNTEWIGDRCDAEIKTKLHLPTVSGDMDKDLEIYKKGIEEGFKKKVEGKFPPEVVQEYRERSDYENETIIPRNFHGYFNVVADYVKFAKGKGEGTPWEGKKEPWLVGPARGSGGGSLNAWLLDITEINPMTYELMFERFLNPARKGFPDFDVDFPQSKRDEMKEYVSWKYGAERVTAIGTFSRLQPRGLLRDLGRAMEIPYEDINTMAGIIEQVKDIDTANVEVSWDEVLQEAGGELAPWAEKYPVVFEKLGEMMGMVRQSGTHAAGMIISDETLLGSIPIRKKGEMITSQFEMYTVEDMGFVKFDFLGIRHLDTLMDADAMVHGEHDPRRYYDMTKSQMAEPEIWKDVHEGKTLGIFQAETPSMTQVAQQLMPWDEVDCGNLVSANRPGVVRAGKLGTYLKRRAGREDIEIVHPLMNECLEDTYGVVVYQEQVMSIVRRVAGYSLAEADIIRRIMGKMLYEEMKEQHIEFVNRCVENPEFVEGFEKVKHKYDSLESCAEDVWKNIEAAGIYCVTGDTMLTRQNGGRNGGSEISIAELYDTWHNATGWWHPHYQAGRLYRKNGLKVLARVGDRIKPDRIVNVMRNGVQKVWTVTLDDGKSITATANHKHATPRGWVRVDELTVGDRLLVDGGREHFASPQALGPDADEFYRLERELPMECAFCGHTEGRLEMAHLDNDRHNNSEENLKRLCNSCHKKQDYSTGSRKKRWTRGRLIAESEVISIEYAGEEMTYCVEMEGDDHSWLANGIITSNSFNKSHGQAYALISTWGTYMKHHHFPEYVTALMATDPDRVKSYIREARANGLKILPPSVNQSNQFFTLTQDGIRYGLSSIKSVGPAAIKEIISQRPFIGLQDFIERTSGRGARRKQVLENLISVGAFDEFGDRTKLLNEFYEWYAKGTKDLPMKSPDFDDPRVVLQTEMALVGDYIMHDPMERYTQMITEMAIQSPQELAEAEPGSEVIIGGEVTEIREHQARNGKMAWIKISWLDEDFQVTCFADKYATYRMILQKGAPVMVKVKRDKNYQGAPASHILELFRLDYLDGE